MNLKWERYRMKENEAMRQQVRCNIEGKRRLIQMQRSKMLNRTLLAQVQ